MKKEEEETKYLDFELKIDRGVGREYPVSVVKSPAGEAQEAMRFPFDELALDNRLKDLQIALLRSGGKHRRVKLPEEQAVQDFGKALFAALFCGEVRSRFDVSLTEAVQQDKGLRLKLRVQSPELAALPWEFMFEEHQGEFICLSRRTPIIRYVELPQPIHPFSVELPLRILGMIAAPEDLPELDVHREKQRIETAVKDLEKKGLVELTWLPGQTWRDLQKAMREGPWNIFHFIGHGGFDDHKDEGLICLANEEGEKHLLSATQLGRLLADHDSLRLVLLNTCEGGRGGGRDIFSSSASILVQRGIPAVIAMQYEITDQAAIEFSRTFYEVLAEGQPIDASVAEARKSISLAVNNTLEWGTPVLYMRSPDGVLFSPRQKAAAKKEPPGAPPPPILDEERKASAPIEKISPPIMKAARVEPQTLQEKATLRAKPVPGPAPARPEPPSDRVPPPKPVPGEAAASSVRKPGSKRFTFKHFFLVVIIGIVLSLAGYLIFKPGRTVEEPIPTPRPGEIEEVEMPADVQAVKNKVYKVFQNQKGFWAADTGDDLMIYIPAGEFTMGSDDGREDEKPPHRIHLEGFWISQREVTVSNYMKFADETRSHYPAWLEEGSEYNVETGSDNLYKNLGEALGGPDYPIVGISWHDAMAYCGWLSKKTRLHFKLPTEAQWEKAARGDDERRYPWGGVEIGGDKANFADRNTDFSWRNKSIDDGFLYTAPAGSYPAGVSPYGCMDMAGNVWEWCWEWYDRDYYKNSPDRDPEGPMNGTRRVIRGGSWRTNAFECRTSCRASPHPDDRMIDVGFRIVLIF